MNMKLFKNIILFIGKNIFYIIKLKLNKNLLLIGNYEYSC
jgi:hypothetical protein